MYLKYIGLHVTVKTQTTTMIRDFDWMGIRGGFVQLFVYGLPRVMNYTEDMVDEVVDKIWKEYLKKGGVLNKNYYLNCFVDRLTWLVLQSRMFGISENPVIDVGGFSVYFMGSCRYDEINSRYMLWRKRNGGSFLGITENDKIQMHAYMNIFGIRSITFMEYYEDEDGKNISKEYDFEFDNDYWEILRAKVKEFFDRILFKVNERRL